MKFKLLILLSSIQIGLFAQIPNYVPEDGLLGWWPFNGNADDESGNGNHGTVNGATITMDRYSIDNKAYSFDGIDDKIEMDGSGFTINQFSISLWVKKAESNIGEGFSNIIGKSNWTNAQFESFSFGVNDSTTVTSLKQNTCTPALGWNRTYIPKDSSFDNQWQHLVITFNGSTKKIYFNTILIENFSLSGGVIICNGGQIKVGAWWLNDPQWFKGDIDDIGIWNRILTTEEIVALYNAEPSQIADNIPQILEISPNPASDVLYIQFTGNNIDTDLSMDRANDFTSPRRWKLTI